MTQTISVLDYLTLYAVMLFSLAAGVFWVLSAFAKTPHDQLRWNAFAAICAAVAAAYQAVVFFKTTPFPIWHL